MAATKKQPDDWIMIDLDNKEVDAIRAYKIARSVCLSPPWDNDLTLGRPYYFNSPSGKGVHILIPIYRKYTHPGGFPWHINIERILLSQLLAGSDPGREKANFFRAQRGVKNWNRLFCTKRLPL